MRTRMVVVLAMRCKLQRVEIVTGKGMPVNEGQVARLENSRDPATFAFVVPFHLSLTLYALAIVNAARHDFSRSLLSFRSLSCITR